MYDCPLVTQSCFLNKFYIYLMLLCCSTYLGNVGIRQKMLNIKIKKITHTIYSDLAGKIFY